MTAPTDHPLAAVLRRAAGGVFPPVDGAAEVMPPDKDGTHAVVCFTGHAFVLTDHDAATLAPFRPDGYGAAMEPALLVELARPDREIGSVDVVLVRRALGGGGALQARTDLDGHPRVTRSREHRHDLRVLGDERGLVTIGTGLVGRTELSVELTDGVYGRGAGRELITAALHEVAAGEPVFAQVAAGNAASLRAFVASGFTPLCSEALITPPAIRCRGR
jgi:hypothetical protein